MFSVVIPLYNKGKYIKKSIDSVLNQTLQNFEIIIVDGNSHDDGPQIVKSYSDPRIYFFTQIGKGVSTARNQGVQESKFKYIAFLDADDEWLPHHLEEIKTLIDKFPESGIYAVAYKNEFGIVGGNLRGMTLEKIVPEDGLLQNYFDISKKGYLLFLTSSVVIPKNIFFEIGGFDESMWWGEDADLWGRLALKYRVAYSKNVSVVYNEYTQNGTFRKKKVVITPPFVNYMKNMKCSNEHFKDALEYADFLELATSKHNIKCRDFNLAKDILFRNNTRFANRMKVMRFILVGVFKCIFIVK